jgi:hypothetical protein
VYNGLFCGTVMSVWVLTVYCVQLNVTSCMCLQVKLETEIRTGEPVVIALCNFGPLI